MCKLSVIQLSSANIRLFCFTPKLISLIHLKIEKELTKHSPRRMHQTAVARSSHMPEICRQPPAAVQAKSDVPPVGTNEYRNDNGTGRDRVVIKSASDKTMEVELYDGYYGEGYETGKTSEYGILTFTR